MPITLSDETSDRAVASLKRYFNEELETELGDLKARLLLDFLLKEIAPSIYNAAVADAQTYLRDRLADLEGACFEPEFGYWPRSVNRRGSK
jgi:uncharacterized protein (DUF2164 family)